MRYEFNMTTGEVLELPDAPSTYLAPTTLELRAQLQPLSAWQVRKVLTQFNLRTQVENAIAGADQATKDAWNHANEYRRDSALLNSMGAALGMTAAQLDSMFEIGATL